MEHTHACIRVFTPRVRVNAHLWTSAHNHGTDASHHTLLVFYFSNFGFISETVDQGRKRKSENTEKFNEENNPITERNI